MIYEVEGLRGPITIELFGPGERRPWDMPKPEPAMLPEEAARAALLNTRLEFCEAQESAARELWEACCRAQAGVEGRPIIYQAGDAALADNELSRCHRETYLAADAVNNLRIAVHARALRDEQPPAPVVVVEESRASRLQDMRARLLGKSSRKGKAA